MEEERKEAKRWDRWNLWLGLPAATLAGAGGVTALTDAPGGVKTLAAIVAVIGGGLAAAATTLNASRRAEEARARAASLRSLARHAVATLALDRERFSPVEMRDAVDDFHVWRDEIEGVATRKSAFRRWVERQATDPLRPGT